MNDYNLPDRYRPLSPWAYIGYQILFSLPIIGFIMLIIYSISDSNINRRNFARSYWCVYIIVFIVFLFLMFAGVSLPAVTSNLPTA